MKTYRSRWVDVGDGFLNDGDDERVGARENETDVTFGDDAGVALQRFFAEEAPAKAERFANTTPRRASVARCSVFASSRR
jgi:hypothetical protein